MARTTSTTTTTEAPAPQTAPVQRRSGGPALNRVELLGRIAGDVEVRYTSSGLPVCSIRVATNDRQEAEFHDCVLWRQLAEFAGQYLAKGRLVYVQGRSTAAAGRPRTAPPAAASRSSPRTSRSSTGLRAKDAGADAQPDEG